jgi:hypothetical protein
MTSAIGVTTRVVLAALATALPAAAQNAAFTLLVDETHGYNPVGNRPALHADAVAFLGEVLATGSWAVLTVPTDGSGEVTVIADESTPVPNRDGASFGFLDNPDIFEGTVAFTGGIYSDINDGIYTSDGGSVATYHDYLADGVPPFAASIDAHGIAFQVDPSFGDRPVFKRPGQPVFSLARGGDAAPGGGTFQIFDLPNMPAYAGDIAAFPAYIDHPDYPDGDGGVYAYDLTTGVLHVVANPDNLIPGTDLHFEFFHTAATDGQNVAFIGNHGYVGFGGTIGLFVAPALSDGQGPITTIARNGDAAPGGGTFESIGPIAIDGDLVAFSAQVGFDADFGLFIARLDLDGVPAITRVLDEGDVLEGGVVSNWSFIHRSMDEQRLVIRVQHDEPGNHYGLYLITFDNACAADLDGSGTLDLFDFLEFANLFNAADPQADFNGDGVLDLFDFLAFVNAFNAGC